MASNLTPPSASLFIYNSSLFNLSLLAATPWIALVSCDKNATDMSLAEDIFTLARDKGAVGAVSSPLIIMIFVAFPMYETT